MQQRLKNMLERKTIIDAELHDLFAVISAMIGYTPEIVEDYEDEIIELTELWYKQQYIDIYSEDVDRRFGRAKDTASVRGSVPWYCGLYHARLLKTGENDPLVVIVFEEQEENGEMVTVASIRFMADHDDLFGPKDPKDKTKFDAAKMRALRMKIDSYIQQGNAYNEEKKKRLEAEKKSSP
ncbi:hypothetical protein [Acinetobacter calcoaceticus]|uniref:hypothetical protein n=1 Tax=Acinetobacter calcoaceticus TaxID=471 RepID=UPI003A89F639